MPAEKVLSKSMSDLGKVGLDTSYIKIPLNEIEFKTKLTGDQENNKNNHESKKENGLKKFYGSMFGISSAITLSISYNLVKKAKLFSATDQTLIRYVFQMLLMLVVAKYKKVDFFGEKEHRKLLLLRGFSGTVALIGIYFSIKFIAPSDATALCQTLIIMVAILARIFLKEKFNITHIVSVLLTIIGD